MIIVGVPYSEAELTNMKELSGGSPYGAGTLARPDRSLTPTDNELRFRALRVVGSPQSPSA